MNVSVFTDDGKIMRNKSQKMAAALVSVAVVAAGGSAQAFAADMDKARAVQNAPAAQGVSPEGAATQAAGTLGAINPDQLSQVPGVRRFDHHGLG